MGNGKSHGFVLTQVTSPAWPPLRCLELQKLMIVDVLGKFDHDLTVLPHWKSWFILGKSSPFMALIQVSEIL